MSVLKLVSKKDDTVLGMATVRDSVEQAKLDVWQKVMRQLKLKWVEEEANATS